MEEFEAPWSNRKKSDKRKRKPRVYPSSLAGGIDEIPEMLGKRKPFAAEDEPIYYMTFYGGRPTPYNQGWLRFRVGWNNYENRWGGEEQALADFYEMLDSDYLRTVYKTFPDTAYLWVDENETPIKAYDIKKEREIYIQKPRSDNVVIRDAEDRPEEERMTRAQAEALATNILMWLEPTTEFAEVAGSYRRGREDPGDLDVVVILKPRVRLPEIAELWLAEGKASAINWVGEKKTQMVIDGVKVDIRTTTPRALGAALLYFTGPAGYNIGIRSAAKRAGFKLSEYGLFNRETGEYIAGATEEDIYTALGRNYRPPTERRAEDYETFEARGRYTASKEIKKAILDFEKWWNENYTPSNPSLKHYVRKPYEDGDGYGWLWCHYFDEDDERLDLECEHIPYGNIDDLNAWIRQTILREKPSNFKDWHPIFDDEEGAEKYGRYEAETFEELRRCNNCQMELTNGEGVKAICMNGQNKYQPNCSDGDLFCDYTCMQRGCEICETIHNCQYNYQIGESDNLCGFCKGCQGMDAETFEATAVYRGKIPEGSVGRAMLNQKLMDEAEMLEAIQKLENAVRLGLISEEEIMKSLQQKFGAEVVNSRYSDKGWSLWGRKLFKYGKLQGSIRGNISATTEKPMKRNNPNETYTGRHHVIWAQGADNQVFNQVSQKIKPESFQEWMDVIYETNRQETGVHHAETQDFADRFEIQIRTSRGNTTERIPVGRSMLVRRLREILGRQRQPYAVDVFGTEAAFNYMGPYGMQVYRPRPKLLATYKYGRFESGEMAEHLNEKLGLN